VPRERCSTLVWPCSFAMYVHIRFFLKNLPRAPSTFAVASAPRPDREAAWGPMRTAKVERGGPPFYRARAEVSPSVHVPFSTSPSRVPIISLPLASLVSIAFRASSLPLPSLHPLRSASRARPVRHASSARSLPVVCAASCPDLPQLGYPSHASLVNHVKQTPQDADSGVYRANSASVWEVCARQVSLDFCANWPAWLMHGECARRD